MNREDIREKIDAIDDELCDLFSKRMDLALSMAKYKKENGLAVLDQERPFNLVPNDRPARAFGWSSSKIGVGPGSRPADHGKTLYTATIKVSAPLIENQLKDLRQNLERNGIWRAKGFVTMSDGTTKKIDYAFGDFFTSPGIPGAVSAPGEIVLIGESPQALSEKELERRFLESPPPSNE